MGWRRLGRTGGWRHGGLAGGAVPARLDVQAGPVVPRQAFVAVPGDVPRGRRTLAEDQPVLPAGAPLLVAADRTGRARVLAEAYGSAQASGSVRLGVGRQGREEALEGLPARGQGPADPDMLRPDPV